MEIYTASQAREKIYRLIDSVADSHEPIYIKGPRHKVVVISEEDFNSIQETLYLVSIPGMREALLEAHKEPLEECSKELDWS